MMTCSMGSGELARRILLGPWAHVAIIIAPAKKYTSVRGAGTL